MKGLKNIHKLYKKLNFALFYFVIYILDNYLDDLLVRYIFLSGCIYFGTFNGGKSSFENYFIQTQDKKFRIEVMHFTSFNLSPNRRLHSQEHLNSCTLIVKAIPHSKPEHQ